MARGVENAGFEFGYNVILCDSDGDLEMEANYIELLLEKKVDGIIFVAAGESSSHVQALIEQELRGAGGSPIELVAQCLSHLRG